MIYEHYSTRNSWYTRPFTAYNFVEITVSGGSVDYDVKTESDLFDPVTVSNDTFIQVYDNNVEIKLNENTNAAIRIDAGASFGFSSLAVTNMYITASGNSRLRILVCGWK